MNIPPGLFSPLRRILSANGDTGDILRVDPVSGGCINHAIRLETNNRVYLLKWNDRPLPGMFSSEVGGLRLLSDTRTVRTPEVIGWEEKQDGSYPAFILLEYIKPPANTYSSWDDRSFGAQLAELHHQTAMVAGQQFGLDQDNYLGSSVQPNGWSDDWIAFFREKRLTFQMNMAIQNGRMNPIRRRLLERLIDRLPDLLVVHDHNPALLHGDLWSGNVIPDENHRAVLIDPAVYYGDREAEIAYTELFGGFDRGFYQAYQHAWPLNEGYQDRRDIYNTYHLINHLNLFGEAYGSQLDAILRYYVK